MWNGIFILRVIGTLAWLGVAGCATSALPAQAESGAASLSPSALPPQLPSQLIDRPLPDVPVATLYGGAVQLAAELGHRPALVSLWATWCDACVEEFDALRRLHARAGAQGAVVVALSVGEPAETVAAFVRRRDLPWLQLADAQFRFADALGEKRVPTTLVIDARGRIIFIGGKLDEAALAALRRAIAARAARPPD